MLDTLQFLSSGVQFGLLFLFVIIIVLFMKLVAFDHRLDVMERKLGNCATHDDFHEFMNSMNDFEEPPDDEPSSLPQAHAGKT